MIIPNIDTAELKEDLKNNDVKIFFGVSTCTQEGTKENFRSPNYDMFLTQRYQVSVFNSFLAAINEASDRIWIIDNYFLKNFLDEKNKSNVENILDFISTTSDGVKDIRLFIRKSKGYECLITKISELNDLLRKSGRNEIRIKTFTTDMELIHDRFAIIDNELWHFGHNVGFSSGSFSATRFGWNANELRIDKFFEELWNRGR